MKASKRATAPAKRAGHVGDERMHAGADHHLPAKVVTAQDVVEAAHALDPPGGGLGESSHGQIPSLGESSGRLSARTMWSGPVPRRRKGELPAPAGEHRQLRPVAPLRHEHVVFRLDDHRLAAHTAHAAKRYGASNERIATIWDYQASPLFSEAERAAFGFALAATSIPNAVTPEVGKALCEHWDEGEIVEILGVISLFGYLNRWNHSMATSLESGAEEIGQVHLAGVGWSKGKHA